MKITIKNFSPSLNWLYLTFPMHLDMAKIKTQLVKRKQKKNLTLEKPKKDEEYFSELDSDESLDSDQEVNQ